MSRGFVDVPSEAIESFLVARGFVRGVEHSEVFDHGMATVCNVAKAAIARLRKP